MTPRCRDLFSVPGGVYLLAHSVGAPTRAALQAGESYLRRWAGRGGDAWHDWLPAVFQDFREALAGLLGGRAREFCPQSNVSSGLTKILFSLPPRRGRNRIVLSELDFPSIGFVLAQARRSGYGLRLLPAEDVRRGPEGWAKALDRRTHVALITHGCFGDGYLNDIRSLAALAKARGAISVVDIAQTAGVVPIDLPSWGADFAVGSCIKWLCGGPGAGFLWARPGILGRCRPVDVGWMSHESPMEFDIRRFRYAPDALRFCGGTPSVAPYLIAAASIRQLLAIGLGRIREHNLALTRSLLDEARGLGLKVATPEDPQRRGGTVVISFKDDAAALRRLKAAGIRCDARRGYGVRFSPHIYNAERDIAALAKVLRRLACLALLLAGLSPRRAAASAMERLEDACSNEIELLCPAARRPNRLLDCLRRSEDDLTSACRAQYEAAAREAEAPSPREKGERPLSPAQELEGRLTKVEGTVYLHTAAQAEGEFIPAEPGAPLEAGDLVRSGTDGRAEIALEGRSVIELDNNSDFLVGSLAPSQTDFFLGVGRLVAKLESLMEGRRMQFRTATAVASVRGTELGITQDGPGQPSVVGVFGEGRVAVSPPGGGAETVIGPGQETRVPPGGTASPPKALAALTSQKAALDRAKARMAVLRASWAPRTMDERRSLRIRLSAVKAIPADKLGNVREDRRRPIPQPKPSAPAKPQERKAPPAQTAPKPGGKRPRRKEERRAVPGVKK